MQIADHGFSKTERDSRTIEYAGRVLDPATLVVITGSTDFLNSVQGQQALLTATNLFARMTYSLKFELPSVTNLFPEIAPGETLDAAVSDFAMSINPQLSSEGRAYNKIYNFHLGRGSVDMNVSGSGWIGVFGKDYPELPNSTGTVGFGACAAVCGAVAHVFRTNFGPATPATYIDLFARSISDNRPNISGPDGCPDHLGNIWVIGCGSIGSSALFFLAMNPSPLSLNLIDGDIVKNHNLDRAGSFLARHLGDAKVDACEDFLGRCPQLDIRTDRNYLHQSSLWSNRTPSDVDVIVAAANEYSVRSRIENSFPPIQIYATTGSYWQTSVWCHVPLQTGCSCCVFESKSTTPQMACAVGNKSILSKDSDQPDSNDASLSFLSFFGGLLTACELYRVAAGGLPPPRYDVWTADSLQLHILDVTRRDDCVCQSRSPTTHRSIIGCSRYGYLSDDIAQ